MSIVPSSLKQTFSSIRRVPFTWAVWGVQFISLIGLIAMIYFRVGDDRDDVSENISNGMLNSDSNYDLSSNFITYSDFNNSTNTNSRSRSSSDFELDSKSSLFSKFTNEYLGWNESVKSFLVHLCLIAYIFCALYMTVSVIRGTVVTCIRSICRTCYAFFCCACCFDGRKKKNKKKRKISRNRRKQYAFVSTSPSYNNTDMLGGKMDYNSTHPEVTLIEEHKHTKKSQTPINQENHKIKESNIEGSRDLLDYNRSDLGSDSDIEGQYNSFYSFDSSESTDVSYTTSKSPESDHSRKPYSSNPSHTSALVKNKPTTKIQKEMRDGRGSNITKTENLVAYDTYAQENDFVHLGLSNLSTYSDGTSNLSEYYANNDNDNDDNDSDDDDSYLFSSKNYGSEFFDDFFESDSEDENHKPPKAGTYISTSSSTNSAISSKRKKQHPRLLEADFEEVFQSNVKPSSDLWLFLESFRQETQPELALNVTLRDICLAVPIANSSEKNQLNPGYRLNTPVTENIIEQVEGLQTSFVHISIRSRLEIDPISLHRQISCVSHLKRILPDANVSTIDYTPTKRYATFRMGTIRSLHHRLIQFFFWLLCIFALFPVALYWLRKRHISRILIKDVYYPKFYDCVNVLEFKEQLKRAFPYHEVHSQKK